MNDLGIDLDLRLVRYFTVVAERRNFGRAAAELHLAQPALSRQIRRLEDRLGIPLFDRTPRGVELTAGGRAFLPEAHAVLRAARRATRTARAHTPDGRVVIGYVEDLVITPAVRELRTRHPRAEIGTRHLQCKDEWVFAEGLVDVLVARAPVRFADDETTVTVLYEEPRVLVMAADHHLAGRAAVTPADFAGEEFICPHGGARTVYPTDAYRATDFGPISAGPVDESFEDRLELIADGQLMALLPVGDRRSARRADLVSVPTEGVPASAVVLVTRVGDRNPLVVEFAAAARARLGAMP